MFRLNHELKTKGGELLTPFLVEGTTVYCFGKGGKTIIKNVSDFNFGAEKSENIVVVNPTFDITDELYENETLLVPPPSSIIEVVPIEDEEKPVKTISKDSSIKKEIDKGLFSNDEYV